MYLNIIFYFYYINENALMYKNHQQFLILHLSMGFEKCGRNLRKSESWKIDGKSGELVCLKLYIIFGSITLDAKTNKIAIKNDRK